MPDVIYGIPLAQIISSRHHTLMNVALASQTADPKWVKCVRQVVDAAGIIDSELEERLTKTLIALPRSLFVAENLVPHTTKDIPLPIGFGQVMTRPSMMARICGLVQPRSGMRILEVGSGSGYLAAILSSLDATVYGVEAIPALAQISRKKLDYLGFQDVVIHAGDGFLGWREHAPYDGIVVSTPVPSVELELLSQLSTDSGLLVAPIVDEEGEFLCQWQRSAKGFKSFRLERCGFDS